MHKTDIGLLLVLESEYSTPVRQFGIRSLCIEERHILRRVRVSNIRSVCLEYVKFTPFEKIDVLHGRANCSKIDGIYVFLVERILRIPVIESGIHIGMSVFIDPRTGRPRDDSVIIQTVRKEDCFQHPGSGPADTVLDGPDAILYTMYTVSLLLLHHGHAVLIGILHFPHTVPGHTLQFSFGQHLDRIRSSQRVRQKQ